jgi:FMN-dependent oxidoreductase (nitrilotriacetate monooxygenase family)
MAADRFHLAWFLGHGFGVPDWRGTWRGRGALDWMRPELYCDFARALERACFDYLIIEDSSFVCDAYGGTAEIYLRNARTVPKHDPAVLAILMAHSTARLGIVPTLAVTEYPPFLLARLVATLDHVSGGRAGWNVVTGSSDRAAQNYGHERQINHDIRYDMADEFTDVVCQLWDSWEPDALVADVEAGIFADHTKVHTIDFEGRFFRCRGPLNTARSPQGRPVLVQAGGSPRGREFAAKNADTIIASATDVADMKAYDDDVKDRMAMHGRKGDDCKVMFLVTPVLAETTEEAQAKKRRENADRAAHPELGLAGMGFITDIDFSVYDLDVPLGELATMLKTNGHQSSLAHFLHQAQGRTLREISVVSHSFEPVGTPDEVATILEDTMDTIGGELSLLPTGLRPEAGGGNHRRPGARATAPRPGAHRLQLRDVPGQSAGVLSPTGPVHTGMARRWNWLLWKTRGGSSGSASSACIRSSTTMWSPAGTSRSTSQSSHAEAPSTNTAPSSVAFQLIPANRSPFLEANCRQAMS